MPHLAAIFVYPLKSFDGISVSQSTILSGGALECDRRYAVFDNDGNFVNGKRNPVAHRIRSTFDLAANTIRVTLEASPADNNCPIDSTFHFDRDRVALEGWLSQVFQFACRVAEDREKGFPDDTDASGPTIISTATLREVTSWFPGLALDDVRRRFRANLEIDGVEPFWEDQLFGESGMLKPFRIGRAEFVGTNPCQRCAVPSRSPDTGEMFPDFAKIFRERRRDSLPSWAPASRFDHFYRLAVNTRSGGDSATVIRVGDAVQL